MLALAAPIAPGSPSAPGMRSAVHRQAGLASGGPCLPPTRSVVATRPIGRESPAESRQQRGLLFAALGLAGAWPRRRQRRRRQVLRAAVAAAAGASRSIGRAGRRASPASRAVAADEDDEGEDAEAYRPSTPRERQFGIRDDPRQRSRGRAANDQEGKKDAVVLPIGQLHVVAAQRQLPSLVEAMPAGFDSSGAVEAWSELLQACQQQAPELLATWSCGLGPLLRLAVAVPRSCWLRSPSEPWAKDARQEVDMDGQEGPRAGLEALPQLERLVRHLLARYDDVPMALAAGFTWSDGAGGTLRERPGREVVLCSGAGIQLCVRFVRLFAEIGAGETKPVNAARELLTPALTKKMVGTLLGDAARSIPEPPPIEIPDDIRHVQPPSVTLASPLAELRRAQVAALGGPAELAEALCTSTSLGKDLGSPQEEEVAMTILTWACRFSEEPELRDAESAGAMVEWLLAQFIVDPQFSLVLGGNPRAAKKVLAAARRDAASLELSRLQGAGQRFLRNPAGVKGFVKRGVMAAFGSPFQGGLTTQMLKAMGMQGLYRESTEEPPNSWGGDQYEPSQLEQDHLADPKVVRKATVRIDEIMSFEYLQHVGQQMKNCLRVEKRGGQSLMKYVSRVKSRDSSFWVMTITAEAAAQAEDGEESSEEAPVQHLLLMEIYNGLRVVHQAEGPHPRRWPRTDAWSWLQEWSEQEKLSPDGPEGVTVGPYGEYEGSAGPWDIRRCFLW
ncbi:unnamed protein product [Polarella glacialis]|uniref:Uncharacterized protein n=1 Tax=Polarella glacialis TaxID=89957 RepID=A0A813G4R4_POLGL|nr:unnamed protein product [Polarella glacialis]